MRVQRVCADIFRIDPRVDHRFGIEQADLRLRIKLADLQEHIVVERRVQDAPLHAHLAFERNEMIPDAIIDDYVALDLHVDGEVRVLQKAVHLAQRRDADVFIALHAV